LLQRPASQLWELCFPHFDHLSADFLRVFGSVLQVEDADPPIVGLLDKVSFATGVDVDIAGNTVDIAIRVTWLDERPQETKYARVGRSRAGQWASGGLWLCGGLRITACFKCGKLSLQGGDFFDQIANDFLHGFWC
jgi:hypothetical protein